MNTLALQGDINNVDARTDSLTSLANRLEFDEKLTSLVDQNVPFGLLMFDIDDFKKINDTYGHHAGDVVLVEIALTLSGRVRQSNQDGNDIVARFGGEELAILLPNIPNPEKIKEIGESIVSLVRERVGVSDANGHNQPITLSAGGGMYQPNEGQKNFFNRVDGALYDAKKSGKNRMVLSSS